jgi:hypothetical protein
MKRNFVDLFESAISRYTRGGFLAGDVVKFNDDAFSDPWYKDLGKNTKEVIQNMVKSGLNLRVSNVKNTLPAVMGAGNIDNMTIDTNLDITSEIAPGRYLDFITIPARLVSPVVSYPNLPEVPEVFKKGDPGKRAHIKPKVVKDEQEEVPFYTPQQQTRMSDIGNNKLSAGDRTLKNQNTVIPSSPAEGHKDPASYTYNYLPKR